MKTAEHRGEIIEYIEVTTEDIETANGLCHEALGRSLDELSPQTRRLLVVLTSMVLESCDRDAIKRTELRFTRKTVREYCGWSDFQVRMHIAKLVEMEYVLAHRGARGQSFVYELLYDGAGRDGRPALMGLIDPQTLASNPCAEASKYDYDSKFEHQKGEFEGSSSIQRASIEHGSRSPETIGSSGDAEKSAAKEEKSTTEGSETDDQNASYTKIAAAGAKS